MKLSPPGFQTRRLGEDREQGGEVKSNEEDLFYENNPQPGFGYHRQRGKDWLAKLNSKFRNQSGKERIICNSDYFKN